MKSKSLVYKKAFSFAVKIVNYSKELQSSNEYVLSRQILKSGTSVGANIREALEAQSRKDFISKMNISLKEAAETSYWLDLLLETNYIDHERYTSLNNEVYELIRMLNAIIKSSKEREYDSLKEDAIWIIE